MLYITNQKFHQWVKSVMVSLMKAAETYSDMTQENLALNVSFALRAALWLLVLWTAMQLGAGFYEKQAVIPLWASDLDPETLRANLAASGHTASSTRFWPFISPVVFFLAIINAIAAWRCPGPARKWWLGGSLAFVAMSITTYAYFVPNMLAFMHRAEMFSDAELEARVSLWLTLSPLRSLVAVLGWFACMRAATLLR
jgi:hypothetical protein